MGVLCLISLFLPLAGSNDNEGVVENVPKDKQTLSKATRTLELDDCCLFDRPQRRDCSFAHVTAKCDPLMAAS